MQDTAVVQSTGEKEQPKKAAAEQRDSAREYTVLRHERADALRQGERDGDKFWKEVGTYDAASREAACTFAAKKYGEGIYVAIANFVPVTRKKQVETIERWV